jgi:hypothetical protein
MPAWYHPPLSKTVRIDRSINPKGNPTGRSTTAGPPDGEAGDGGSKGLRRPGTQPVLPFSVPFQVRYSARNAGVRLTDWLNERTANCPQKDPAGPTRACGAVMPDLVDLPQAELPILTGAQWGR